MSNEILDRLIPLPRLLEVDHVDLAAPPARVWPMVRHADLARSPLIRALFAVRTLRVQKRTEILIDRLTSTPEQPGFQILGEDPGREVAVGAIGKVWRTSIPFTHVAGADAFAHFSDAGWVKVAWAVRVLPRGAEDSRVEIEVRVDTTDEASWRKFSSYFTLIGPASRFIRRSLLRSLARELGDPEGREEERKLAGDELLPDAAGQLTHGVTLAATPEQIWPWLIQMGCGRGGFYSVDALDNGGVPSAREVHPELQDLRVGQILPARPDRSAGFEVLRLEAPRVLVLGGLYDPDKGQQLPFAAARPAHFWQTTWAFALEPLDARSTRLHVRGRAAFGAGTRAHVTWMRFVHRFMESAQLRHLAARVEGRLPRDDWRDVREGLGGAARMALALATPFLRGGRRHWGVPADAAERPRPGDELVPMPRWSWTHGVEIDAPAAAVWPWVAQVGAGRAGFYSYQWLENLAGCDLRNAETIHPEWQLQVGEALALHPDAPPLRVVEVEPGRHLVAHGAADVDARAAGRPWSAATWLFQVEPLDGGRCRLVSRFRADCSDDVVTRLTFGESVLEPIGFTMDRRMLLGIKERAERSARAPRLQEGVAPC